MIALILVLGFAFGYFVLGHMVIGLMEQRASNKIRTSAGMQKARYKVWI